MKKQSVSRDDLIDSPFALFALYPVGFFGLFFGFIFCLLVLIFLVNLVNTVNPWAPVKTDKTWLKVYEVPIQVQNLKYPKSQLFEGDCYHRFYPNSELFIRLEKTKGFIHIPYKSCPNYN